VNVVLRRLSAVSLAVLGIAAVGCTESRRRQEVSASLDRIDVLIAHKKWEAALSEGRRVYSSVGSPSDAYGRLNAQLQLLEALMIEESRAELEKTHMSVADLFAMLEADEVQANRSYAGKEVHVKGHVGMFATDQFDRPYITLHSKDADEFSTEAIFRKHDTGHEQLLGIGERAFVTCKCDGKVGNVIIITRCSLKVPRANGIPVHLKQRETRKCGDGPRECA
jgi:hypothetical protein